MVFDAPAEIHVLCAYVTLIALVGAVGNLVILLVYAKRRDRRATNEFIRALAGLDLCVCLIVMPYTIVYEYHLITVSLMCKVLELTRHFNVFMSNLTLVAIAAERYFAICKPTFTITPRHVQKGLLVMAIVAILMSIPSAFIFAVVPEFIQMSVVNENNTLQNSTSTNSTIPGPRSYCMFTVSIIGKTPSLAYQGFLMVVWFACIMAIVVLYALVYRVVWKRDKARNLARVSPAAWTTSQSSTAVMLPECDQNSRPTGEGKLNFLRILNMRSSKVSKNNATPVEEMELSEMSQTVDMSVTPGRQFTGARITKKSVSKSNAHRKTGTMLFLCTVVYIVTWMPFWLDIFGVTNSLAFRHLFFLSSASNPVIYGIVNQQVRNAMLTMICGRKPFINR